MYTLMVENMNKIKLEPSKDLAYILGVLYSDGCVKMYNYNNRPYYIIIVKTKDKIFAENVYNALKNIGLNVRIYISNGKYYEVESHSKMFVVWFLSLTLDDLLKIVDGYEKDFIRGFYEGDGNLSYRTKNGKKLPQIRFFNSNYKIIKLVRDLLIKLGYHPTPIRV